MTNKKTIAAKKRNNMYASFLIPLDFKIHPAKERDEVNDYEQNYHHFRY
jgi:hypothetical protein